MNNPNQNHPSSQLDHQVEEALRNFRLSVHSWSEQELVRRPAAHPQPARSLWSWMLAPAVSWAAAAALAIAAIAVPLGVHHRNTVVAQQKAAEEARQHQLQEAVSVQAANTGIDDDKLFEYVDADIAQQTPDAMQPLANLMKDSGAE